MNHIRWSESRHDRTELQTCSICTATDSACGDNGFTHTGRRWEIGITWPGSTFGRAEALLDGACRATVEDLHLPDRIGPDRLLYRGACVGCGWAADRHHRRDSNSAIEDALDHALPDWRRVPIVERLEHDASNKQRDRWLAQVADLYAAHSLELQYSPGAGGVIRTMRTGCGTRSHWSHGFYDVCAGVIDDVVRLDTGKQMELF